jgi:hypothetical protein
VTRLRGPDWLGELQGLTALVMAVAVALSAVRVALVATGDGVPVELRAHSVAGVPPEAAGVTVDADATVGAVITDPSGWQVLLSTLTWLPTTLLVVAVLALVFRTLRAARRADPFTPPTVRRLRILAAVAVVGGATAAVTESLCGTVLVGTVLPDTGAFSATLTLPIGWVFAGFVFLAVGELIRRGCALRAELAGVI